MGKIVHGEVSPIEAASSDSSESVRRIKYLDLGVEIRRPFADRAGTESTRSATTSMFSVDIGVSSADQGGNNKSFHDGIASIASSAMYTADRLYSPHIWQEHSLDLSQLWTKNVTTASFPYYGKNSLSGNLFGVSRLTSTASTKDRLSESLRVIYDVPSPRYATQQSFATSLKATLEAEDFEYGIPHRAEAALGDLLDQQPRVAPEWIEQSFDMYCENRPSTAAGIIRCLGQLPHLERQSWAFALALRALSDPNLEIREAASMTLESWGGRRAYDALVAMLEKETVSWLRTDIAEVIETWPMEQDINDLHSAKDRS